MYMIRGGMAQPSVKAFAPNSLLLCFFDPLHQQSQRHQLAKYTFRVRSKEPKNQRNKRGDFNGQFGKS
jgi:hypothetical protein